jgi:hypothetical protein
MTSFCSALSFTTKHACNSSIDHGGAKRRGTWALATLHIISSRTRSHDFSKHFASGAEDESPTMHSQLHRIF